MRILAVAGDASFLVALSLMAGGWEVVAAPDAAAAAPVAAADPTFDAAVVDLRTTERGIEAVNFLRHAGVAMPCLVVGDLAAMHESATVITRPYTLEGLIGSLRAVMEPPVAGPSPVRTDQEALEPAGEAAGAGPAAEAAEAASEALAPAPPAPGAAEATLLAPEPKAAEAEPAPAAPAPLSPAQAESAAAETEPAEPADAEPPNALPLPAQDARRPRRPGLLRGIVGASGSWRPALRLAAQRATETTDHAVAPAPEDDPPVPSEAAPALIGASAPAGVHAAAAAAPSTPAPPPSTRQGPGPLPDPRAANGATNRSLRRMFRLSAGPEAGIEQPQRQRDTLRRLETAAVGLAATIALLEELPMASDVGAVARAYLEEVVETLAPEVATLYLSGAGGTFWPAVHVGLSQVEANMPVPADHPLFVDVAVRLGAVLVAPVHLVHGLVAGIGGARTETLMAAPLQLGGVCYGVGIVGGDAYAEADLDLFTALGLQAAGPLAVALRLHQLGQIRGERLAN